jgi:hypothetical protein
MANEQKRVIYRSSKTGEFVKQQFAKNHPNTTEREKVRVKGK